MQPIGVISGVNNERDTFGNDYTKSMLKWRLGDLLQKHNITPYRLSESTKGRISRNVIYEIARSDTKQVKLETLDTLIRVLRTITNENITLLDLLEYSEE